MKLSNILAIFILCLTLAGISFGQNKPSSLENQKAVRATPAFAEVILRKAELESDVESFLVSYTESYPKLKERRFELDLLNKDLAKLFAQTDASKLTLALGKLLVRKSELETDLWALQNQFSADHPDVKRAKRKVLSFQNAIKEILP